MFMSYRRSIFPKNLTDWVAFLFISIIIALFYWFEFLYIFQKFYPDYSLWPLIHFTAGSFIMMNISSNFVAVMLIDTSIFRINLSTFEVIDSTDWPYCEICKSKMPPRCWHCKLCNCCILKRDHHCTFTGCCIGHENQRFFLVFLFYFFIFSCYSWYLNVCYILPQITIDITVIFQIMCPLIFIIIDFQRAVNYILIVLLVLNVIGSVVSGYFLYFQLCLLFRNSVMYQHKRDDICKCIFGFRENVKNTFGERWYLVWISVFISSPLPFNGAQWDIKNTPKNKVI